MTEELEITQDAILDAEAPKRHALVVRGFVSRIVDDPDKYTDPVFTAVESDDAKVGQRWTGDKFVDPVVRRQAQVRDGVVINVCDAAEGYDAGDGSEFIPSEAATTGQLYDGGEFKDPPLPPVRVAQLEAERDRRLDFGFVYDFGDDRGEHFIATTKADNEKWSEVTDVANAAINAGIPDTPIGIQTGNGLITITASEWQLILLAAGQVRQPIYQAYFTLKALPEIPQDYADDSYWSAK